MSLFALFAVLISVTALLSYLNERYVRLPPSIGMMAAALSFSILLLVLGRLGLGVDRWAERMFEQVDFNAVLLNGMLSFLLFAGALHVDLGELLERKWSILLLATIGVVLSTFLVGTAFWALLGVLGLEIPYVYALIFGALISPTDPIAVLGILKSAGVPKGLQSMIIGESLFNDGVGVVVFSLILSVATGGHEFSTAGVVAFFFEEAIGGAVIGLVLGFVAHYLLKGIDNYSVELLITLSLVSGGYVLAGALHASGPIAMVVAGLLIGNHGRLLAMSDITRERLDTFWELVDEVLNAVLFVMIGFEVLVLEIRPAYLLAGILTIPLVLAVRYVSVGLPMSALRPWRALEPHTVTMMTWGGLRGGISIALALSVVASAERDLILVVTYTVVVFSILVQGLSVGRLARWIAARS